MRIGPAEFEQATGRPIDPRTLLLLAEARLDYKIIPDQQGMMDEIQRILEQGFDKPNWEAAWEQTLRRFVGSGYDLDALNPTFVGSSTVHRWQGKYIEGIDHFERRFNTVFRDWVFRTFLGDVASLYEFGSGSGINVAVYATMFPDRFVAGLDFAPAAVEIANLLHSKCGLDTYGMQFDFLKPRGVVTLDHHDGVLTWCALEQVGKDFEPFIDFLLARKPRRVVHVEPILGFYDASDPFDQLAIEYHKQRGYLRGLLPALLNHVATGKIRMIAQRRTGFGSRFHEGYSIIAWEPA